MASWAGGLISLIQVSIEAPRIFAGLTELFIACDAATLQAKTSAAGISEEQFNAFMQYAASFYGNLGVYAPIALGITLTRLKVTICHLATPSLCPPSLRASLR
jgi:hypothetical protein